ncbi:hypothetical protein DRB89_42620 [Streptomyces sp. ICC4]|nr:hypothetical protein DRB89_42620 [Streptomyces sp. ICC4]
MYKMRVLSSARPGGPGVVRGGDGTVVAGAGGQREALAAGVLRERTRLAAELHDTVAQGLTSMHMLLDAADQQWTREPLRARQLVRQAAAAARENLEEARRLIHDLAPPELDRSSLPEAVRGLCARAAGAGAGAEGVRFRLGGCARRANASGRPRTARRGARPRHPRAGRAARPVLPGSWGLTSLRRAPSTTGFPGPHA